MSEQGQGFDELYFSGKVDDFLEKAKKSCEIKIRGMKFAGMSHEDVIQEVLIKVYRTMSIYNKDRAKVSTYIDHVITNMIRDCLRKAGARKNLLSINTFSPREESGNDSMDEAMFSISAYAVRDASFAEMEILLDIMEFTGLTEREKKMILLRLQGYSYDEIGKHFGITKERVCQIIKSIQKKYQQT